VPGRFEARGHWDRAERRRSAVFDAFGDIQQQRARYEAVCRLAHDNDLRARAFARLAELDLLAGDDEGAAEQLGQALLCGPSPEVQREILLALGDVLERRLGRTGRSRTVYEQLVHQHPGTPEAELAGLRLEMTDDGD
jgi:hypothetical protein